MDRLVPEMRLKYIYLTIRISELFISNLKDFLKGNNTTNLPNPDIDNIINEGNAIWAHIRDVTKERNALTAQLSNDYPLTTRWVF